MAKIIETTGEVVSVRVMRLDSEVSLADLEATREETLMGVRAAPASDTEFHTGAMDFAKSTLKDLEAIRTAIVRPLNDQVATENARFKGAKAFLAELEALAKGKILEHQRHIRLERETREAEAQRAALEARRLAAAGDAEAARVASAAALASLRAAPAHEETKGTSIRKTWVAVVDNEAELDRALLMPNPAMIKATTKNLDPSTGAPRPVKGLRFEVVETVARRSGAEE